MRALRLLALFLCSFMTLGAPGEPDRVAGEWVFYRARQKTTWNQVTASLRSHFRFIRAFGPGKRFALYRALDSRSNAPLPKIAGIQFQPNFIYRGSDAKDPDFEKSWGLSNTGQAITDLGNGVAGKDIGAPAAWSIFAGNKQTVVAIIDTGIDTDHEDLKTNIWRNPKEIPGNGIDDDSNGYVDDIHGWNFVANSSQVYDDNRHGTFCAGIIGATAGNGKGSRGVLAEASMMAVKTLDTNGYGTTVSAVSGIEYAVKNGASVINASWGGTNYDAALYEAVRWAGTQGVLFVAAAGNDFKNNDTDPKPIYPASFRLPRMISVAAYDHRDTLADFSCYGKETVHIGAPGVGIFSTIPGGYNISAGTSFAAPFVSAVSALVKGYVPSLTVDQVKDRVLSTSEVIHYYEKARTMTAGRVHASNALRDIRPPRPMGPPQWTTQSTSVSTAHPYAKNFEQTYRVESPGAKFIRVKFKGFETESCCDTVTLKDKEGRIVATYAGLLGDFTSAEALGDTLDITLKTDFSKEHHGFDIETYETGQ